MGESGFEVIRKRQARKFIVQFAFGLLVLVTVGAFAYRTSQNKEPEIAGSQITVAETDDEPELEIVNEILCYEELPDRLVDHLDRSLDEEVRKGSTSDEDCTLVISSGAVDTNLFSILYQRPYVLVTRADAQINSVSWTELRSGLDLGRLGNFDLLVAEESSFFLDLTHDTSSRGLANPTNELKARIVSDNTLMGILPLDSLNPKLKVIPIDGISPFSEDINPFTYPLTGSLWSTLPTQVAQELYVKVEKAIEEYYSEGTFNKDNVRTVIFTGRSAIGSRSSIPTSEESGINFFNKLKPYLMSADISVINNEVSYLDGCTQAISSKILCGLPTSFNEIPDAGFDIVGLSGQSTLDQGRAPFEATISSYIDSQMSYYGGGLNRSDALKGTLIEQDDFRLFITGFSLVTPTRYLSTERSSGTLAPDKVEGDAFYISETLIGRDEDELQIVDMQWGSDTDPSITTQEKRYADALIGAKVDLVFGTNALTIKPMDYIDERPVFYGLGNFGYPPETDEVGRSIMLRLNLYNGRFLTYDMIPTLIDSTNQIQIDMDSYAEILNTVYEQTSF